MSKWFLVSSPFFSLLEPDVEQYIGRRTILYVYRTAL